MRVLITGGAGFLGYHLATRIRAEGHPVDLVDDLSRGVVDADLEALLSDRNVRLIQDDISRPHVVDDLRQAYQLIFHLAGIVGVRHVLRDPGRVLDEHARANLNLLTLARRQDQLERFVYASSSEVYARAVELGLAPVPTPEAAPLVLPDLREHRSVYSLSKLHGEALYAHSDIPHTVVRPHNLYGPRMGMAHVVPELLQRAHAAADGGDLEVYSVGHRRTFCYVDDAVELLWRAATERRCAGQVINVGAQEPEVTMRELAARVSRVVGKQLSIVPLGDTPGSPSRRSPDMSRAVELTGYAARVSLEAGLRRTYEWYEALFARGRLGRVSTAG